jgi:hypothetical protein
VNEENPPLEGAKLKNVEISNVDVREIICWHLDQPFNFRPKARKK